MEIRARGLRDGRGDAASARARTPWSAGLRWRARRRALSVLVLVVALATGCGDSHSSSVPRRDASWPAPNGDTANHRRATSSVDAASVDRLHVAWRLPLSGGFAATPIVLDGVVYAQDLMSNVYAIDLASGRLRWRRNYQQTDIGPNGVNVASGRVFGATQTSAFALDAETGHELWSTQLARHPGDAIDMAPGYADGTVYVSTAVAGAGAVGTLWALAPVILDSVDGHTLAITAGKMGVVYAFDAQSGRLRWRRPVGLHNGHDRDNLLALRGRFEPRGPQTVLPGWWGGVETQMASDGEVVYVPVNDLATVYDDGTMPTPPDPNDGNGRMVALDVASGRVQWDRRLPRSPYGAATISNDLVFTTTYDGTVWALARSSGEPVWSTRLPGGTNAPVVVAGDTLIAAASVPAEGRPPELVAYRLDAADDR